MSIVNDECKVLSEILARSVFIIFANEQQ